MFMYNATYYINIYKYIRACMCIMCMWTYNAHCMCACVAYTLNDKYAHYGSRLFL